MFKLDLTGLKINQYRLLHSKKFRGLRFIKTRNTHDKNGDLTSERNVIAEYLLEKCEIDYTMFTMFMMLFGFFLGVTVLVMFINIIMWIKLGFLVLSFISLIISKKKKEEFVLGEVGIDMVESFYNEKIKDKFNL